ncbi:MAG: serine hydrolase [Tepidiformaceae bacterium]
MDFVPFESRLPALLLLFSALLTVAACGSDAPDAPANSAPTIASGQGGAYVRDAENQRAAVPTPSEARTPTPTAPATPRPFGLGLPPPPVTAAAALVTDEDTGVVLFELNPNLRLAPASLTKVATAVVVLESLDLEREVEANPDLVREWLNDSSTMGLEPGDRFTVRELLYGLLLLSGNDAAEALALATSSSEEQFVSRLNGLAARLRLRDTHFSDEHGLGGPDHFSSAADLALLTRYAMSFPVFRQIVGTEEHLAVGSRSLPLYNLNPLLGYTPGVDGVKTGYTEEAGRTFIATATRSGRHISVVLLNAPLRTPEAIALIEWAFANFAS